MVNMEIKWHKLKDLNVDNFKNIPKNSGIYFVRWSKDGSPVSIPRLDGIDQKGILYIGSAKELRRRIRELWKGINGRVEDHTIGKTIIFCKVFEIISLDEYEISWEELKAHEDAVGQEWTAMASYAEKYREPPPLNLQLRRGMFTAWDIFKWDKSRWAYETDEFVKFVIDS